MQILDSKFATIDRDGKSLIDAGVLKHSDIDAAMKGDRIKGKIMFDCLPAYSLLHNLLRSAKSNTPGILLSKFPVTSVYSLEELARLTCL